MQSKVLLVDDSRDLLDAYVAVLEATTTHEVRTATSGRAALGIVRDWRPDIVVTDIMMSDVNGLELITHLRSELPPPLPIIVAWSGFPDFEVEARRRGAMAFQPKPIDPDDLVVLIESLLGQREIPEHLRAGAEARRRAASELARAQVSSTLARRPHFREVAELNARLISRYFDGADVGLLVMDRGHMTVFAASDDRWRVGTQLEGALRYAVDVVESGSTLIAPDLGAIQATRPPATDERLLVAVPLQSEGVTIGALALADRRRVPFDVQDLAILEHIGARHADVFAGRDAAEPPREPGVLTAESWRFALRCELEHLHPTQALVIAMASLPASQGPCLPVASPGDMAIVTRVVERRLERLPARTALGRLGPATLAVYGLVADAEDGARRLRTLVASLADKPEQTCVGVLTVRELDATDGGVAYLGIAEWLLASAMAHGPGTALQARLSPEVIAARRAA